MSKFEKLKDIVTMMNLHTRGKKMKALELLEETLFGSENLKLNSREVNLVMMGYESKKGLLGTTGGENHIRKSLKNSAHYALQLVVKIIEKSPNSQDAMHVLGATDRLILKQMKIDKHFKAAESSRKEDIFYLCMRIKQVKPALPVEAYITRQVYQERFLKWLEKKEPSTKTEEEPERWSQWVEPEVQDHLGIYPVLSTGKALISTEQLDIKSGNFKPLLFLNKFHSKTSISDLRQGLQNLKKTLEEKKTNYHQLVTENSEVFGECHNMLEDLKTNLAQQELQGNAAKAHEALKNAAEVENSMLNPLVKQKAEMERVKRLIHLSNKYSYLFKLPNLLQSYLANSDFDSVVELCSKNLNIIKEHSHLPLFSKLMSQLQETLKQTKNLILENLKKDRLFCKDTLERSINHLDIIDSENNPVYTVMNLVSARIKSNVDKMFAKINTQVELPWLKKGVRLSNENRVEKQASDQFIMNILDKSANIFEVLCSLLNHPKLDLPSKALKKVKNASVHLANKLASYLFENDPKNPLRSICILEFSEYVKRLSAIIPVDKFKEFTNEFTRRLIITEIANTEKQISELYKEELWSKDFENKYGTCLPRIFQIVVIEKMKEMKHKLPQITGYYDVMGQGIKSCLNSMLVAMQTALNTTCQVKVTKSEKILLSISNTIYLKNFIVDNLFKAFQEVFETELSQKLLQEKSVKFM